MKKKQIKYIIILLVIIVIAFFLLRMSFGNSTNTQLKTEIVEKTNINNVVTATGTLEASVTVNVGTQVSGKINKLNADYNSNVKKGQLLAVLDTETLESSLESSKAALDLAQAEFDYQASNYQRNKQLIEKKLIAQNDFDEIEYKYKSALANLNSAKAKYKKDKTNLNYAYIYSPIDGVVLKKNVEEGETVAASFETPTLFTIANDLTQMEIEADVDEADIGKLKGGQRVEFTVDAYPEMIFKGEIIEIHLMPNENSNVITYTVIINAPNPLKILMPGMTANVSFYVTEQKDVLAVSYKALEFYPEKELVEAYMEKNPQVKFLLPERMPNEKLSDYTDIKRTVWLKSQNKIFPKEINVGQTDEVFYEVISGLESGDEVIISLSSDIDLKKSSSMNKTKSPFMPSPPLKK